MNVFIDTNALLDVLAGREPFHDDSARIWTLAEAGVVTGFVSALSFANIFYILRRIKGPKAARQAIRILRDIFTPIPLDAQTLNQAIDADIKDFEDAIQFFSAIHAGAAILITRNPKDFPAADLVIQTPTEFLATHFPDK